MEADLRFPVGKAPKVDTLSIGDRVRLIGEVADAPAHLRAAVKGLTNAQLDTPYRPGGWTVRQVVHHLPDGHLNWYLRAKFALTGSEPSLPFDENVWAELPDGRCGEIEPSLMFFEGLHARTVLLFESLTPEDWTRKLSRSEVMTIQDILPRLAWHSRHHTAHITELRKRMGW